MTSRYRVSLGGVHLDTLDDHLLILDVQYSPVEKQDKTSTVGGLDGYDMENTYYSRRTVTVSFELHIYDTAKRNAACQKVNAWAQGGGNLRVNDRENQFLEVECEQLAEIGSVRNWTDPLTLVFTTTGIPFWRSNDAKTVTVSGTNASGTLKMDGNTQYAYVLVTATARAKVTSFRAIVGDTEIKLTGLNIPSGKKIEIDYVHGRYLRIRGNGSSVMKKLDPASSDRLLAACGQNVTVSAKSDANMNTEFVARGLWL